MKKPDKQRTAWLLCQVKLQAKKSIKLARQRSRRQVGEVAKTVLCILTVPPILTAEKLEMRQKILMIISQIEARLRVKRCRVKLDFSRVKRIFPGGMLILIAALRRLSDAHPGRIHARCPPKSLAAQLLNHFGLADALGVTRHLSTPTHSSVVEWQHLVGSKADGDRVKELLDTYRLHTQADLPDELFLVLTEGLTNVAHHAYPAECAVAPEHRKWWLFSRFVEPTPAQEGSIYIAIYDIGVGIPATLRPKIKNYEHWLNVVDKTARATSLGDGALLDQRLLRTAIEESRSQTFLAFRGKGLPEMREFAASTDGGRLHIVSGQAQYSVLGGRPDGQLQGFGEKFPGTLLLWNLPLKGKEQTA